MLYFGCLDMMVGTEASVMVKLLLVTVGNPCGGPAGCFQQLCLLQPLCQDAVEA